MLESQWARWIEVSSKFPKDFIVAWKGDYNLEKYLQSKRLLPILKTRTGESLANWAYDNRYNRSKVDQRITQIKASQRDEFLNDIFLIESWFNQAYNLTISEQHGCKIFESISGSFKYQLESLHLLDKSTPMLHIEIPEHFVIKLGELPNDVFRNLFLNSKENFKEWWSTRDIDSLERGILPFVQVIENQKESPTRKILERVSATGIGVGISHLSESSINNIVSALLAVVFNFYIIDKIYDKYLSRENRIVKRITQAAESRLQ